MPKIKDIFGTESIEEIIDSKKSVNTPIQRAISRIGKRVKLTSEDCKALCRKIGLEYLEGYENRVIERVFTDETVDRYGDIVKADGLDISNYMKNPTVLVFHNGQQLPVGSTIKLELDEAKRRWVGWILCYDDRIDRTGYADTVFRFASSGALKGVSIGFIPNTDSISRPSEEERKKLRMPPYGLIYTKSELLECSVTPIPANPNARDVDDIVKRGIYTKENIDKAMEDKIFDMNFLATCKEILEQDVGVNDDTPNMTVDIEGTEPWPYEKFFNAFKDLKTEVVLNKDDRSLIVKMVNKLTVITEKLNILSEQLGHKNISCDVSKETPSDSEVYRLFNEYSANLKRELDN